MPKTLVRMILLWLLVTAAVFAETYNAILISLDGAERTDLYRLLAADKLPALKELLAAGGVVEIKVEGHVTSTAPGHAEMLTGLPKELNKVVTNKKYDAIPEGLTIGERLKKALGKNSVITMMLMGKAAYMGSRSAADYIGKEKPESLENYEPYYYAKKHMDVWEGDESRTAEVVGAGALHCLDKYYNKRFFMFCHFIDTDASGHHFGENSPEYENAFIKEDTWIGNIMARLKKLKLYEKTLIYVTADHGFDKGEKTHNNAPDIFLVTNDRAVKKNGTQADIAPTILSQFNIDLTKLVPKLPGKALNR